MNRKKDKRRATLADALDLTKWDFAPGQDRKVLLKPVGSVFSSLPWEIRPQYLGPAPITDVEPENEQATESDVDTQPLEPLEE